MKTRAVQGKEKNESLPPRLGDIAILWPTTGGHLTPGKDDNGRRDNHPSDVERTHQAIGISYV